MKDLSLLVLLALALLQFSQILATGDNQTAFEGIDLFTRKECRALRRKHRVKPGTSWGTMTKEQQDHWIEINCDQFFCEPHQLAGKGVYKCIPVRESS